VQVIFCNWLTTYGEVLVRVAQRAYKWHRIGVVSDDVTYVVCPLLTQP
jgi:hypothetical protein